MSKASTPASSSIPTKSAWAKGPPPQTATPPTASSASSTSNSRPTSPKPTSNAAQANQNGQAQNGQGAHSRKPSLLAGGRAIGEGVVVGRGAPSGVAVPGAKTGSNINFGSIDDSSATLSSSPATHPSTGSHLETAAVRAFGSVVAAAPNGNPASAQRSIPSGAVAPAPTSNSPVQQPSAAAPASTSTPAAASAEGAKKPKINVHSLFQSAPSAPAPLPSPSASASGQPAQMPVDRRGSNNFDSRNGGPPPPGSYPQQFYPQQQQGPPSSHLRPPQPQATPRSPTQSHQQPQGAPQQQGGPGSPFRPTANGRPGQQGPGQQQQQGPNSSPRPGHQQMQGMPPPQMMYPPPHQQQHPGMPYGYYYPGPMYQDQYYQGMAPPPPSQYQNQPYGQPYVPQHQQQQQQMPLSPRGAANVPLSSPSPSPSNAQQTPAPSTPQHRPANLTQNSSSSVNPTPTPPPHSHSFSRPSGFNQQSTPFSPSAHHQQPSFGGPHQGGPAPSSPGGANLRGNAVEFQPAKKTAGIKFSRPDGGEVDIRDLAGKPASASTPPPATAASPSPAPAAAPVKIVKPNLPKPPVVVRLETPAQQAARKIEEEREQKMKDLEKQEEIERKERDEKRKAAAKEKEAKDAADKEAAEKKAAEEEEAAKVKAAEEEKEQAKKAEEDKIAAEKKKAEDDKAAADKKKADEEAAAMKTEEEAAAAKKAADEAEVAKKADEEKKAEEAKKVEDDKKAEEAKVEEAKVEEAKAEEKPVEDEQTPAEPAASSTPAPAPPAAAGLPPKPSDLPAKPVEAALEADKKKTGRPAALDLSSAGSAQPPLPSAVAQSLQTARFISEPNATAYPEGIRSPAPELNASAPPGKFRYDRDFLLQFMEVCKEKPESLPPLADIGLEADTGSSFGGARRGGPSRSGSSMGPPGSGSRSSSFAGTPRVGGPVGGGFSMGMGSFGTGGSVGKTSADRFAQSQGGVGFPSRTPMSRQPSAGSAYPSQVPASPGGAKGARVRSERGRNRSDAPAFPMPTVLDSTPVAPLVESANRWISGPSKRGQPVDENSPAVVERKVKGLLNKLTMENFDSISGQILTWANKSEDENDGRTLRQVIKLIFEKATDEAHWSEMYARLCRKMMDTLGDKVSDEKVVDAKGQPVTGGSLFRKYLLNRCQEDFEKGWAAREASHAAAQSSAADDKAKLEANEAAEAAAKESGQDKPKEEAALMSDEYYIAQKAKRQGLGLVRLIGELFKLEMLTERIMHECVKRLLANVVTPEEEDIESLCRLLTTVGKTLDSPKAKPHMDVYFSRMNQLRNNPVVASRMQFMLLEVVELRSRRWQERNETQGVQTLQEIRDKAARDAQKASQDSMNRTSSQRHGGDSSRGGSRRGQQRTDFGAPQQQGGDGWNTVAAPPRNPGKVGDLAHFGKIEKRAPSGPQTFGPSTVFGKNRGKPIETPPMSRQNSSSNMFSLLNQDGSSGGDAGAAGAAAAGGEPAPQRKRLVLKPRSVPVDGAEEKEDGEEEEEEEEEGEDETEAAAEEPSMDAKEAERLIKTRVDEFFNVKDLSEAVLQLKEIPAVHRKTHVEKLVAYAIDAKKADFDLTVQLFSRAADESAVSADDFKAGFASTIEFLDDLVSDVPKAYTLAAHLLAAAKLSKEDVDALGETINLDNEPVSPPKERLAKEFEAATETKAE